MPKRPTQPPAQPPSFTPAQLAFNAGTKALGKRDTDTALAKFLELARRIRTCCRSCSRSPPVYPKEAASGGVVRHSGCSGATWQPARIAAGLRARASSAIRRADKALKG
jgi:hypothetical protein